MQYAILNSKGLVRSNLVAKLLFCTFLILLFLQSFARAQEPLRIVYGFDREFHPFSYQAPGGEPVGFEVDLIKAIFNGTNTTLSMRPLSWEKVQLELAADTINVASGMIFSLNRSQIFLFSQKPSVGIEVRLFTKVYNRYASASMLKGQAVSVESGSYQQRVLENFGGINIKPYPGKIDGLRALYMDEVDAYCGIVQPTYYYINKLNYGAITTVGTPLAITSLHYAVNKRRGDIHTLLNQGLDRVIASGEYNRIYRKWFVRELTDKQISDLISSSIKGAIPSYVPYGTIKAEGAAILTVTGKIYTGCSIENADPSYNITAIQSAISSAVANGEFEYQAVVLTSPKGDISVPSNEDLQRLYEFGQGILCITHNDKTSKETKMIAELITNPVTKYIEATLEKK